MSQLNSKFTQHSPIRFRKKKGKEKKRKEISNNHSLWNNPLAISAIDETYEMDATIDIWNYRSHVLLGELEDQTKRFACSGGVWTQTTDVEGEVNGLLTYDRRLKRVDEAQWKADIQALYDAAAART